MTDNERGERRRQVTPLRAAAALAAVFLIAVVAAVTVPFIQAAGTSQVLSPVSIGASGPSPVVRPAGPAPTEGYFAIVCRHAADDYCPRRTADILRRAMLTPQQQADAAVIDDQVTQALPAGVEGEPVCEPYVGADGEAVEDVCTVESSPPSVRRVRHTLVAIGHADAVVRVARPDDPAPSGSVLIVVPAGDACILVIHDGDDVQSTVAGRLPGGGCIPA